MILEADSGIHRILHQPRDPFRPSQESVRMVQQSIAQPPTWRGPRQELNKQGKYAGLRLTHYPSLFKTSMTRSVNSFLVSTSYDHVETDATCRRRAL